MSSTANSALVRIFSISLFLAPIICFFAPKAMAPIVIACAVFGMIAVRGHMHINRTLGEFPIRLFVASIVWATLSAAWANDMSIALIGAAKLAGILFAGLSVFALFGHLAPENISTVKRSAFAGLIILVAMLAIEGLFSGPIYEAVFNIKYRVADSGAFWLNNSAAIAVLMMWSCALTFRRRSVWMIAFLVMIVAVAWLIGFRSGFVAGMAGCMMAGLVWLLRRKAMVVAGITIAIVIGFGPLIPSTVLKTDVAVERVAKSYMSMAHRFQIWNFTADRIAEKPVLGWGMNASRIIPGGTDFDTANVFHLLWRNLPLHPHNATLQIWLELGAVGATLWAALWLWLLIAVAQRVRDRTALALFAGYMTTLLILLNLSYGIWQAWWLGAIALTGVLFSDVAGNPVRSHGLARPGESRHQIDEAKRHR